MNIRGGSCDRGKKSYPADERMFEEQFRRVAMLQRIKPLLPLSRTKADPQKVLALVGEARGNAGGGVTRFVGDLPEREFFIGNLLVRIHFVIVVVRWTGLAT